MRYLYLSQMQCTHAPSRLKPLDFNQMAIVASPHNQIMTMYQINGPD